MSDEQTRTYAARTWRVRSWIRLASLVAFALLCWEQSDIIRRAGRGEMPATEVRDGFVFLAVLAGAIFLLAFWPSLTIRASGDVLIRNPVGSTSFRVDEVESVGIDQWGLVITLTRERFARSIVFQGTAFRDEPRWFDVAEALTGTRPLLSDYFPDEPWDDEEHDDD